jgi:branched-chain amino acid transport system substrate-binding protein
MRFRALVLAAAAAMALSASGCGKGRTSDEIRVGEYSSLTGTTATFGQSTHNAVLMAYDEVNAAGGVLGRKIKVFVEDDQSKPEEAATAAT